LLCCWGSIFGIDLISFLGSLSPLSEPLQKKKRESTDDTEWAAEKEETGSEHGRCGKAKNGAAEVKRGAINRF
jgi:hypothetical protein